MASRVVVGALSILLLVGSTSVASERFFPEERLGADPADWVTLYDGRIAFGSGERISLAGTGPSAPVTTLTVGEPVLRGVLAGRHLYLALARGGLGVLDLDAVSPTLEQRKLSPVLEGNVHLARMDDYLLVAEDDRGLRILALPTPPGHGSMPGHAHHDALTPVGFLPLAGRFSGVAVSGRSVRLAVEGQGLALIDTRRADAPLLERIVPLASDILDVGANGTRVYLLEPEGLRVMDLSAEDPLATVDLDPSVRGEAIRVVGRKVYVAAGDQGLVTLRDHAPLAATTVVAVGDNFFDELDIVINVGDTVEWQKPFTAFTHNVVSCTPAEPGCGGATSNEAFNSGAAVNTPFNFQHTFLLQGLNPYLCRTHFFVASMKGSVTVTAPAAPPPAVPDGDLGPPLRVDKIVTNGSRLELTWDTTLCTGNTGYQVVHGMSSMLPGTPGGIYGLNAAAACSVATSPFNWLSGVPNPSAGLFAWFLVLVNDGSASEGSWGTDGFGNERTGPAAGGHSGKCGVTAKDLTNTCGQ